MTHQRDWIQIQVSKEKKLAALRAVIADQLAVNRPFSECCIRITLYMIRANHGEKAYQATLDMYGLADLDAA